MIKSIKPLPISEERLGAYLEGKLSAKECNEIEDIISGSKAFEDFVNEISQHIPTAEETIYDTYPDFDLNFELPQVPDIYKASTEDDIIYGEEVDYMTLSKDEQTNMLMSWSERVSALTNSIPTSEHLGSVGNKNYGYEPNYELDNFDPDIYQGANNTCAIRCQQIVLRDYGIMFSQNDLVAYATKKGWFDPDPENGGTDKNAVGNIIDDCGIKTTRTDNATIYDIIAELRAGHRVIVTVDADELWVKRQPNVFKRLFGKVKNSINDSIQDVMGVEGANHALIVAGVNVNPNDPKDIHVTLIDSGTGEMCVEYTFKEFENAWKDGNHRMVSTTIPAPYQYNSETHQMEPSGFDTEFRTSMAEIPHYMENQFVLSRDYENVYGNYVSEYNGTDRMIAEYDMTDCHNDDAYVIDDIIKSKEESKTDEPNSATYDNNTNHNKPDENPTIQITTEYGDNNESNNQEEDSTSDCGNSDDI